MFAYSLTQLERLMAELTRLRDDRKGVTALEYGIIAAVTVAAVGTVIGNVGESLGTLWTTIQTSLAPPNAG